MNQNSIEKTTYDIVTTEEAIKNEKNNIIAHFFILCYSDVHYHWFELTSTNQSKFLS